MKSVWVVKLPIYTHSVEVKTSNFFVEKLPTFSLSISQNRSSCRKSFGSFDVYIFLNKLYFSINFHDEFLRFSSLKMVNP